MSAFSQSENTLIILKCIVNLSYLYTEIETKNSTSKNNIYFRVSCDFKHLLLSSHPTRVIIVTCRSYTLPRRALYIAYVCIFIYRCYYVLLNMYAVTLDNKVGLFIINWITALLWVLDLAFCGLRTTDTVSIINLLSTDKIL